METDGVLTASALLAAAAIFPTSHGRFLLLMYAMAISFVGSAGPGGLLFCSAAKISDLLN